ncbi:hypothetical protein EDC04DRAFT_2601112 [Pisolithus marmoratus]|nr:hypothetical protein EDC04DRAFT_2601112 [Pisolithus marmoratus]
MSTEEEPPAPDSSEDHSPSGNPESGGFRVPCIGNMDYLERWPRRHGEAEHTGEGEDGCSKGGGQASYESPAGGKCQDGGLDRASRAHATQERASNSERKRIATPLRFQSCRWSCLHGGVAVLNSVSADQRVGPQISGCVTWACSQSPSDYLTAPVIPKPDVDITLELKARKLSRKITYAGLELVRRSSLKWSSLDHLHEVRVHHSGAKWREIRRGKFKVRELGECKLEGMRYIFMGQELSNGGHGRRAHARCNPASIIFCCFVAIRVLVNAFVRSGRTKRGRTTREKHQNRRARVNH